MYTNPNENEFLDRIIKTEGGFVNNPADKGGPTKYGITIATLADYRGHPVTATDVANLSEEEARDIYLTKWLRHKTFRLSDIMYIAGPELAWILFDSSVLFGRARAVKWLQATLNVTQDGIVGPKTLDALNKLNKLFFLEQVKCGIISARMKRHVDRSLEDHSQLQFLRGWTNRTMELLNEI